MTNYGTLRVGLAAVGRLQEGIRNELLTVFRDNMLQIRHVPAHLYYVPENGWPDEVIEDQDELVEVVEFRAPGEVVAARLDLMGFDAATTLAYMDEQLSSRTGILFDEEFLGTLDDDIRAEMDQERDFRLSINGQVWVDLLSHTSPDPPGSFDRNPGSRMWLLNEIDYWDERFAIRIALLAFPHAEVVLDVTELGDNGWLSESGPESLASNAVTSLTAMAGSYEPVVVLTEGRTDTEFLAFSLEILYPHLTDLIRFLDYERKPEGGAAALVRMIRAFAAAGIGNRVVAVFDNDTAAADGLRSLDQNTLPAQMRVIRYPAFDLLKAYPTLGPPTLTSPMGSVTLSDVNGLAGSIELYLGRDVLTLVDGKLCPVQWKAFIPGMKRYQGEVTNKELIHELFRAKATSVRDASGYVADQDWEGLRLIIDSILIAARDAASHLKY